MNTLTEAQKQIVEKHLYLAQVEANKVVRRNHRARGHMLDDLKQDAVMAIVIAAQRHKPELAAFATYASRIIRGVLANRLTRQKSISEDFFRPDIQFKSVAVSVDEESNHDDQYATIESNTPRPDAIVESKLKILALREYLASSETQENVDLFFEYMHGAHLHPSGYRSGCMSDLAKILGITRGAVQSRIARMIAKARQWRNLDEPERKKEEEK